MYVAIETLG